MHITRTMKRNGPNNDARPLGMVGEASGLLVGIHFRVGAEIGKFRRVKFVADQASGAARIFPVRPACPP